MDSLKNGRRPKRSDIHDQNGTEIAVNDARLGTSEQTIRMRNSGVPVQVVSEKDKSNPHDHLVDRLRQNGNSMDHHENEENSPTKTKASVTVQTGGALNTKPEVSDQQVLSEPDTGWKVPVDESHDHEAGMKSPVSGFQNSSRIEQAQTFTWIKNNYEEDKDNCLAKHEVYKDYESYCTQHGIRVLGVADFGKVFKCVFPAVTSRRLGPRGQSIYYYNGIRKKPSVPTNVNPCHSIKRENINDNDLEEASKMVVCEWAQKLLSHPFSSLRELADFLVSNLYVNSRSAAAFTLIESMNTGGNKTTPGTLSPNINKHRETQLQLQKALQLRQLKKKQQEQQNQENGGTQEEPGSKRVEKEEPPPSVCDCDNEKSVVNTNAGSEKSALFSDKRTIRPFSENQPQKSLKVMEKTTDEKKQQINPYEKSTPALKSRLETQSKSSEMSSEGIDITKESAQSTAPRLMNLLLGPQISKKSQKGAQGGNISRVKALTDSANQVPLNRKSSLKEGISAFTPISVNSGLPNTQHNGLGMATSVQEKTRNQTGTKDKLSTHALRVQNTDSAASRTLLPAATSVSDSSAKVTTSSTKPQFLPIRPRVPNNKTVSDLLKEQRGYGLKAEIGKSFDRRAIAPVHKETTDNVGDHLVNTLEQSQNDKTAVQQFLHSGQKPSLRMSAILKNSHQLLKRKMEQDSAGMKRPCVTENITHPTIIQNATPHGNVGEGYANVPQAHLSSQQSANTAQGISNRSQTTNILSSVEMDSLLDDPELGSLVNANQLREALTYIVQSNSGLQGDNDRSYSETHLEEIYQNQNDTEPDYSYQCRSQPVSRAPSTEFKEPPKTPLGKFRPVRTPTGDFHMRSPAVSPTPPSFTEHDNRFDGVASHSLVRPQPARTGSSLQSAVPTGMSNAPTGMNNAPTVMNPADDATLMSPPLVNKPLLSRSRRRSGNLVTNTVIGAPPIGQDQQPMASPPAIRRVSFQEQTIPHSQVVSKSPEDQAFSNSLAQMLQNIQRQRSGGTQVKFDPNLQRPLYSPGMCRSAPASAVPSPITWDPRESAPSTPRDSPIHMENNISNPGSPYISHGGQVTQVLHPGSNRSSANNTPTFGMSQHMGSQEDISPQNMAFDNNGPNTFASYDNNAMGSIKKPPSYQAALAHQMAVHSHDPQRSRHHSFPSSTVSVRQRCHGSEDFTGNSINFPENNVNQNNVSSHQQHKFTAPTAASSLILRQRHMSADTSISRNPDLINTMSVSQTDEAYDSPFSPEMQAIMDQQGMSEDTNLQTTDPGADSSLIQAVESLLNFNTELDSLPQENVYDMSSAVSTNAGTGNSETIKSLLRGKLNVNVDGQSNRGLHFAQQSNYQARRNITGMLESNCGHYSENIQPTSGSAPRNFGTTIPYSENSTDQYSPDINFTAGQISSGGQTNWMNSNSNPSVPTPPNSQTTSPSFAENFLLLAGQDQQKANFSSETNFAFDDGSCQSDINYSMYQGNGMPS